MTQEENLRLAVLLKAAADMYGRPPLTQEGLRLFALTIQDYSWAQVERAIAEHIRTSPYFPKPADVVAAIEGTAEGRAAEAWVLVLKGIDRHGSYQSVSFGNPATHYAIQQMGGWVRLCDTLTDRDIPFRAKDFTRLYVTGERSATFEPQSGKTQVPLYLMGEHEIHNRTSGYDYSVAVYNVETGKPIEAMPRLEAKGANADNVTKLIAAVAGAQKIQNGA